MRIRENRAVLDADRKNNDVWYEIETEKCLNQLHSGKANASAAYKVEGTEIQGEDEFWWKFVGFELGSLIGYFILAVFLIF
jgi:hypothetical protein